MEVRACHGIKKVLLKLENSIKNGNYYEAHQMYRTLYFRYLGQQRYSELISMLYNGSILLLEQEQFTSGADLGILLVDVLKKSKTPPSQTYFDKLTVLFSLMSPVSPEREFFIQNAIKWSTFGSIHKSGHPHFHRKIAQVYWNEKNFTAARQHFLYTNDGSGCAKMLLELFEEQGYLCEADLFITQIVLQYLCLQNKTTASEVFKTYVKKHPQLREGPPFILPLLNFLCCLLQVIDMGETRIFSILCDQYTTCLSKDPCLLQYIDKIGQIFFNIQPSQNCSSGLFNSFLYSFFNGIENEDDNKIQVSRNSDIQEFPELD